MKKKLLIILIIAVVGITALMIFKSKAVISKSKTIISEVKEATSKKVQLIFELTESGISIAADNEPPILQTEMIAEFTLEKGIHSFSFYRKRKMVG